MVNCRHFFYGKHDDDGSGAHSFSGLVVVGQQKRTGLPIVRRKPQGNRRQQAMGGSEIAHGFFIEAAGAGHPAAFFLTRKNPRKEETVL